MNNKIIWDKPCDKETREKYSDMKREESRTKYTTAIHGRKGIIGFPERLECVRNMRNLSQSDLAVKIGLKPMTGGMMISHWERGRRTPHIKHLRALCVCLNVSADYLLDSKN